MKSRTQRRDIVPAEAEKRKLRALFQQAQDSLRMKIEDDLPIYWSKYCCDCIFRHSSSTPDLCNTAKKYFQELFEPSASHREGYVGWWEDSTFSQQDARLMALQLCELSLA